MLWNLLQRFSGLSVKRSVSASNLFLSTQRQLHLHEGISKQLLAQSGCHVQRGTIINSADEIGSACERLPGPPFVLKAQILAGGRGKGVFENGFQGGVHVVSDVKEAHSIAQRMLNQRLITKQTGSDGLLVTKLLVAECVDISKEFYISLLLDRSHGGPVLIASQDGGMDIESVAEQTPERIITVPIDISTGLTRQQATLLTAQLSLPPQTAEELMRLYEFAKTHDVLMLEINPLASTKGGEVVIVDAKIHFDDSAAFRNRNLWALEDLHQKDPKEVEAAQWDLNYVALQGNVGCLVNGAGLAMATMDLISLYGGKPANFLDVGGGASTEQVAAALRIIHQDPHVQVILVNIFGGIAKCDVIARGILEAFRAMSTSGAETTSISMVVRLSGTNAEQGQKILRESGLRIHTADDLDSATKIAISLISK